MSVVLNSTSLVKCEASLSTSMEFLLLLETLKTVGSQTAFNGITGGFLPLLEQHIVVRSSRKEHSHGLICLSDTRPARAKRRPSAVVSRRRGYAFLSDAMGGSRRLALPFVSQSQGNCASNESSLFHMIFGTPGHPGLLSFAFNHNIKLGVPAVEMESNGSGPPKSCGYGAFVLL